MEAVDIRLSFPGLEGVPPFTREQARAYWRKTVESWKGIAHHILVVIDSVQDPLLKKAVSSIIDAVSSGYGVYRLEPTPNGFRLEEVHLDDDVVDRLLGILEKHDCDPVVVLDEAVEWITAMVRGVPAPFVGWAFGPIEVIPGKDRDPQGRKLAMFSHSRILYSFEKKAVIGILTHNSYNHPSCRIIKVK
jgi:hypothetical protein